MTAATKSKPSSQRALETLRQMIFGGDLPAGSDHLETELAERLAMSRTPVREALLALEAQGLVEIRPRRGIRILPVAPEDMRDIYEILTALESTAAASAAERRLGDAELSDLTAAMESMEQTLAQNDLEAWAEADERFHQTLVALSGNSRMVNLVGMMRDQVRRARLATLHLRPVPVQSNRDHRAVLDAIRKGDAATARQLYHEHGTRAREALLSILDTMRIRQL